MILMTEDEWQQIRAAARLHGQSASDYVRVNAGCAASEDLEQAQAARRARR